MVKLKHLFVSALLLPSLTQAKLPFISGGTHSSIFMCNSNDVYSWGVDTLSKDGTGGLLALDKKAKGFEGKSIIQLHSW